MPKQRKVGRLMLPKEGSKGKIVPVQFNADDLKKETASRVSKTWDDCSIPTEASHCSQRLL